MKITKPSIISTVVVYKTLVWGLGMRVSGTVFSAVHKALDLIPSSTALNMCLCMWGHSKGCTCSHVYMCGSKRLPRLSRKPPGPSWFHVLASAYPVVFFFLKTVMLGIRTQVLILVQQALYLQIHLPNHKYLIFLLKNGNTQTGNYNRAQKKNQIQLIENILEGWTCNENNKPDTLNI